MTIRTITEAISDPSADGIARGIGALVTNDSLPPGSRLPTVRELANALDISPTTVGDAWQILRRHRIIDTEGRRGSFVREVARGPGVRYWRVPATGETIKIDLGSGVPDARLLPDPLTTMRSLKKTPAVTSYLERPVLGELEHVLTQRWPFTPGRLTVLNGAMDALDRLIQATVNVGDKVGISDPGFPPLFDMLEIAGAQTLALPLDAQGLDPTRVAQAVDMGMTLLIVQPRAHNPTGISMTATRRNELAEILADRPIIILEDDHSGSVSNAELHSLGAAIPNQVVHVRSFSKSHGPDFRIAAVGGASEPIGLVERRRMLGPSWTSRLLQEILAAMLTSPSVEASIQKAANVYASRRGRLVDGLAGHGIEVGGTHGLNVWVPVQDEATAVPMLSAHGIGVARGRPFRLIHDDDHFIRVTTSALDSETQELADRLAEAAQGHQIASDQNGGQR
ncbi:MAG: aminotransferase class I/II-fold pyridoxal phosphate-dependent enzyme [Acidimicrobiia bacterium]|nr:MAG: aminotransferase class I/II-fold pyridoxal phosphate-dependent enzyme [Acidimicrobiia bacterium]